VIDRGRGRGEVAATGAEVVTGHPSSRGFALAVGGGPTRRRDPHPAAGRAHRAEGWPLRGAEADLVIVDPEVGVTIVEVKGGTVSYDARRAIWRRSEAGGAGIRDPVTQAKRVRSVIRDALRHGGIDVERLALRWVVAVPDCRLEAPGSPILDEPQLWDSLAADRLAQMYARTAGRLTLGEKPPGEDSPVTSPTCSVGEPARDAPP
jgi:hypothetical protein